VPVGRSDLTRRDHPSEPDLRPARRSSLRHGHGDGAPTGIGLALPPGAGRAPSPCL